MKKSYFSEEQILDILNDENSTSSINEICNKHNISLGTYYKWRAKYGQENQSSSERISWLERRNQYLSKLYNESLLDKKIIQDALEGKL